MYILLLILGSILLLASLVLAFRPKGWAVVAAWCSMLCFSLSGTDPAGWHGLLFWGVAAILVLGIDYLQAPSRRPSSRMENAYVTGGALVGAIVGMIISTAGLIVGAAIGAFFGALAWSRTPGGRSIVFPSSMFFNRLLALGLPAVVVMSIACHVFASMLNY